MNKEKKTVGTQTDPYVDQHLTADIERLNKEKKDLDQYIKALKNQAQSDKVARDQELQELKEKVTDLTSQLTTSFDILGNLSDKGSLYLRAEDAFNRAKRLASAIKDITDATETEITEQRLKRKP